MDCEKTIRVQGRCLAQTELLELQSRINAHHPEWSRHRIARDLCERWEWRTSLGRLKTFAARSLLLTLEARHGLRLPPVRVAFRRAPWGLRPAAAVSAVAMPAPEAIATGLGSLQPLQWRLAGHGAPERARALAWNKRSRRSPSAPRAAWCCRGWRSGVAATKAAPALPNAGCGFWWPK